MEIFELKYFSAVAKDENIHRAAEKIRTSPASLSKAISRLEEELGVSLFSRDGRGIKLTEHGILLKLRAAHILRLEEATKAEIQGHVGSIQIVLSGPEVLLSKYGIELAKEIRNRSSVGSITFRSCDEVQAIKEVVEGDAHLCIVTRDIPEELTAKQLSQAHFQTVAGKGHPLYSKTNEKVVIPIEEILKYPFVSPSHPILGKVGSKQSLDGWRDDMFPRKVEYITSSLKLLETLVSTGQALAYLPDYYVEALGFQVLKVSGCPYTCVQKVKIAANRPKDVGWLNRLF